MNTATGSKARPLWGVVAIAAVCLRGYAEPAHKAESVVDSVGINVHLHYTDTAYFQQFSEVKQALLALHVRHLRDGLVDHPRPEYLERYKLLGSLGMKTVFITKPNQPALELASFPGQVGKTFEGFEAPNEMDNANDPAWPAKLREFLPTLFAVGVRSHLPVVGPSLVKAASYPELGDVSRWESFGNLHNYPGGRNPGTSGWGDNGYGSFAYHQRNLNITSDGLPIVSTETGYDNDPSSGNFVPEPVSAKYLPRLLLQQYINGVRRTYLYELLSSGHEDYGLMSASCAAKPGFRAVSSLLGLLDDRDSRAYADDLDLRLTGASGDVRHLLLQKSNRHYLLAVWIEAPGYDLPRKAVLQVPPQMVHFTLPWTPAAVISHRWNEDGTVRTVALPAMPSFDEGVTDSLTIVEITPPPARAGKVDRPRMENH